MEKTKIAAVVVTFNRKQLLLECLEALKSQTYPLDAIYIIDGPSTDGTPEVLLENNYIDGLPPEYRNEYSWENGKNIHSPAGREIFTYYIRLYEDVGGAGGFYEGVKRACEKGYDWLWLMDDDAEPIKDALDELVRYIYLPDAVAFASVVREPNGEISLIQRGSFDKNYDHLPLDKEIYNNEGPISIDIVTFVGPMISSSVIKSIGLPRKEFFIYADDTEYSYRLREVGKIYLVPTSTIVHKRTFKRDNSIEKILFGRKYYRVPYAKLLTIFFRIRNGTYLRKKYYRNKFKLLLQLIKHYTRNVTEILLLDDHKLKRILLITSAYLDGWRYNLDNEKPKKILYGREKK